MAPTAPHTARELHYPAFVDATHEAGLYATHAQGGDHLTGLNESLGAGACAFDYDNDGWVDIFVVGGSGQSRYYGRPEWWHLPAGNVLYRNLGNGRFEEVTQQAGLTPRFWGIGCAAADLDNDGDDDLFLTNIGSDALFRNNGDGTFADVTASAGLADSSFSTSAAIADYDNDGLPDIYVVNYLRYEKGARTYETLTGYKSSVPIPFNPALYDSEPNRLYRNTGNLVFQDVTADTGVADASGRGLAAQWLDVDDNGYLDLLVSNDEGLPNALFLNRGKGAFEKVGADYRINTNLGTTGIAAGDFNNDGRTDIALGTGNTSPPLLYMKQPAGQPSVFLEVGRSLGLGNERHTGLYTWALGLEDFNNDGWLDLFLTNGFITPDSDNPKLSQGQPKSLWLNQGGLAFTHCGGRCGEPLDDRLSGRGLAFADFDNDGDVDIYASHNNNLGQLLLNTMTGNQHWLGLTLVGDKSNRDAIGAKITLSTDAGTQYRTVGRTGAFLSARDKRINLGLGAATVIRELSVHWPSGRVATYANVPLDTYITLREDASSAEPTQRAPAPSSHSQPALTWETKPYRLTVIEWLLTAGRHDSMIQEIWLSAAKAPDPAMRRDAVELALKHQNHWGLAVLLAALDDAAPDIRLAAVQGLRNYEEDIAVRWLLRKLDERDPALTCAIADTFAFFFREEEAVINQKYLAVPYLIRLLGAKAPEVRQCAAAALGDSETYRSALPLAALLRDPSEAVRIAAARSMGLIREQTAVAHLVEAVHDPHQPPAVVASTLVALKRLNYADTEKLLDLVQPSADSGSQGVARALRVLAHLMQTGDDSVVIAPHVAATRAIDLLQRQGAASLIEGESETLAMLLRALNDVREPYAAVLAEKTRGADDDALRIAAYQVLLPAKPRNADALMAAVLPDRSNAVRQAVLQHACSLKMRLGPAQVQALGVGDAPGQVLPALRNCTDREGAEALRGLLLSPDREPAIIAQTLRLLADLDGIRQDLPDWIRSREEPEVRAAALYYDAKRLRSDSEAFIPLVIGALNDSSGPVRTTAVDVLLTDKTQGTNSALQQLLSTPSFPLDARIHALTRCVDDNPAAASSAVFKAARLSHDPLSEAAIRVLPKLPGPSIKDFLITQLESADAGGTRWFALLEALHRIAPDIVINHVMQTRSPTAANRD